MSHLNNTDLLALERTKMANERTFLAYFRTFTVFLSSGFAVMKLEILQEIHSLGIVLIILSPLILMIGIFRIYRVRAFLKKIETMDRS